MESNETSQVHAAGGLNWTCYGSLSKDQDLTNTNGDLMGYNRYIHCWLVWNMIFMTFHHIGDVIIPTDEVVFFRDVAIPPIR